MINLNLKDFVIKISLHKFFELGGELTKGQTLLCIEHYPCMFLGKRLKYYQPREGKRVRIMHYKVKFLTKALYPKGKFADLFEEEISVPLNVFKSAILREI